MKDTIKKLDELFVKRFNHSKVMLDYEDENKTIKLHYQENKGYGKKSVIIYWQHNEINDIRTNYSFKEPPRKLPNKENVVELLEGLLIENIEEELK